MTRSTSLAPTLSLAREQRWIAPMKRFFKIVAIFMAFATVLAYLIFRVVFFDPFEDAYGDTERLVPSDVHFMIRRANLDKDFEQFPNPAFFQILSQTRDWQRYARTDHYEEFASEWQLGQKMADFEAQLAEFESFIDPMDDILGREVMIMGRHRDDDTLGMAMVFRASNKVKFFADAVRFGLFRSFAEGIKEYREDGEVAVLTMQDDSVVGLLRRLDLVVIGDDPKLVADIGQLADGEGSEFSLTDSQYYTAAISEEADFGRPLDIAVDVGAVARANGWERLEVSEDDPADAKWLAQTIVPGQFNLAAGRVHLGQQDLALNLRASADMTQVRQQGGGFWDGNTDKTEKLVEFCANVLPKNVYCCGLMRLDVDDFLMRLEGCMAAEDRQDLGDFIKRIGQRPDSGIFKAKSTAELISLAAPAFGNQVVFAFEPQEPYSLPGDDTQIVPLESWGPRVALLLPVVDRSRAEAMLDLIIAGMISDGWKPYSWKYRNAPYTFREMVTVTSEPSVCAGFLDLEEEGSNWLAITTTGQFLDEIVRARVSRKQGSDYGTLSTNPEFREARKVVGDGASQGFLFMSTDGFITAMEAFNPWIARQENPFDAVSLRQAELIRLRDKSDPRQRGRPVTPEFERSVEAQLDEYMRIQQDQYNMQTLPDLAEKLNEELAWAGLWDWTIMSWAANQRDVSFRLHLRSLLSFP